MPFCGALMLFILSSCLLDVSKSKDNLCSRIYFKAEEDLSYIQIEGVYERSSMIINGFPVFKHEGKDLYFHYIKTSKLSALIFTKGGTGSSKYFGVYAQVSYSFDIADVQNGISPFQGLILNWVVHEPRKKANYIQSNKDIIQPRCVDKDFYECSSGSLYFNDTITNGNSILNNLTTDFFRDLSFFVSNRPVYKHNRHSDWYLFYQAGHWIIGDDYSTPRGRFKAKDTSLRPEQITVQWEYNAGDRWVHFPNPIGLKCKGTAKSTCVNSSPCLHNGRCIENSINETVCRCSEGYHGPICASVTPTCTGSMSDLGSGTLVSYSANTIVATHVSDLATIFCDNGYTPEFYRRICTKSGWVPRSPNCVPEPTTTQATTTKVIPKTYPKPPPPVDTTPKKQFNTDDYYWAEPVAIPLIVCLELFHLIAVPIFHWKRRLDKDLDASFGRYFSFHVFIAVVLWAIYLIGCRATVCGRYGRIFIDLVVNAFVVIPLGYIIILCESLCSAEHGYISSMLEGESISEFLNKLKAQEPERTMNIECWHMETRTRTVYYTDANGNTQTRVETYQERVTTYTEQKTFEFRFWRDISDPQGPQMDSYGVTRLKLSKDVDCGDEETTAEFLQQRKDMIDRNEHMDEHCDFTWDDNIPGFQKRVCMYADAKYRPWWMSTSYYWLATLLGLSWPYRVLFNWKTSKSEYEIKKEIFLRQPAEIPRNEMRPVHTVIIPDPSYSSQVQVQETSFHNTYANPGPSAPPPDYFYHPAPDGPDPRLNVNASQTPSRYGYEAPPPGPPPDYSVAVGQCMGTSESQMNLSQSTSRLL